MDHHAYCEEIAAPVGSPFRYATYRLPAAQRQAMHALGALHRELDSVPHTIAEPSVARARLNWWQEELTRLEAGAPNHPITCALADVGEAHDLPAVLLQARVEGALMDTEYTGYQTVEDLDYYLARSGGVLWRLYGHVLGLTAHDDWLGRFGVASRRLQLLHYMGRDLAAGRIYLPAVQMERAGVRPADLMRDEPPAPVQALLDSFSEQVGGALAAVAASMPEAGTRQLNRAFWPARVTLGIDRTLHRKIREDGNQVLNHRVDLSPARMLWISFIKQWQHR
ncbi:MAG: phytoene/squalene synthase family protein [Halothiobacillaceae bacterium]